MVMENLLRAVHKQNGIIDAAINLFLKYGAKKTSMDDIAKESGVSKVTVYKYFSGKDTLCQQVFEALSERYMESLNALNDTDISLNERMVCVTQLAAGFISSGHKALCEELTGTGSHNRQGFALLMQRQAQLIHQLISEGKQHGIIQSGLGDDVIFHYIDMGLCYYQYNMGYRNKIEYDTDFRERFMALIWRNIFEGSMPFKS